MRCCLAAIDHIGFSKGHANKLRQKIGEVLSIGQEQVMLCFSHTHSAPNEDMEAAYRQMVYEKVCGCAGETLRHILPVDAAWGNAEADIGFNRRKGADALDRRIGVCKVTDAENGALRLVLLRVTAHANVLKRDNHMISPDFFGAVRDKLEQQYGCPVMVTQGAAGNVAPKYVRTDLMLADACDDRVIRSADALNRMAEEITAAVLPVLERLQTHPIQTIRMYGRSLDLVAEVPSYERAIAVAEEAMQKGGIDGTAWLAEVKRLLGSGVNEQIDPTEVQVFRLDEGCLCGVANEIMCEFALEVWKKTGNEFCWFGGYTNGCTGYFPTEEEFDFGGYEVYWSMLIYYRYHGRVFPLNRDSAARLIDFVAANVP